MKLWEVIRFEVACQLRRRSTWIYAVAVLALAFYGMQNFILSAREAGTLLNAPIVITNATVVTTLFGLLVTAALFGDAATRDVQLRMASLLYTTPLRKRTYLGGRFLGAFALNALLLALVPVGVLLAVLVFAREPELTGPFRLAAYLQPYLFLALPNAFIAGALLFTTALLSRRALTSYVAGTFLLIASMFIWQFVATVWGQWDWGVLLDPLGFTAVGMLVKSWTPLERSTRLIPSGGPLLANRLLWLGITAGVGGLAHLGFRFAHHAPRSRWRRWNRRGRLLPGRTGDAATARSAPVVVPHVHRTFGLQTRVHQAFEEAGRSLRQIGASRGWLFPVGVAALLILFGPEWMEHLGVPRVPTTYHVVVVLAAIDVHLIVVAFTVFYAGEMVWRERDAGLHAITDATPVPDGVLLGGRLLGLGMGIVVFQALLMAAGITVQSMLGYYDFELGLYLKILFGFQLVDYLLFAALALAVHVLVNQKYVGHLVVLLAYAFTVYAGVLGIEHNLLVYGSDVAWAYSDLSGFGPFVAPFLLFKLYWMGWALLLTLVARLFWVRGTEHGLWMRLRSARQRLAGPARWTAALGVSLVLTAGGLVLYNTNGLNDYRTTAEAKARRAEYERRYGQYKHVPQPRLTGTQLHVEIHPDERAATVHGTYRLLNRSDVAIDSIHLATAAEVETGAVDFDRAAVRVLQDDDLGHRIYALAEPLRPGDSLRLGFEVRFRPRGFSNDGVDETVVGNGTSIESTDWLPALGYQPDRQLSNAGDRRAHSLDLRPAVPALHDVAARRDVAGRERIDFEAVIGTDTSQVAVAPGTLRRTWAEGDRRYFHYATDAPIRNLYALFSADYAVHTARAGEVEIQIFHHPEHALNLDRMVRSVRTSLDDYTEHFGPYPHRLLRLVEAPGSGIGLRAYPINIRYTEGFALLNPEADRRDIDLPFAVVAHEVAHQWWGNQLAPAKVEGAALLSESLAWYSALGVVEKAYGEAHLRRLLALMREAYLAPRPQADVPLLRATDWLAAYRKGPFAMYTLRQYLGEERVNAALRRFLEAHGSSEPPLPTSLDLYEQFQAVTPDSLRYLLSDLFETNTFWGLEASEATAYPVEGDAWRVTLEVETRKVAVDSAGTETGLPMNDLIEIGVFAPSEDGGLGEPLYLRMHRIRSGRQQITVTVPREPARAGIDPYHLLSGWNRVENIVNVERRR